MKIEELFIYHRKRYLEQLKSFTHQSKFANHELLVVLDDIDLDSVFQYYRADAVDVDGQAVDCKPDEYMNHETIEYVISDKRVLIDPFIWGECDIFIEGEVSDWGEIISWCGLWFDLDELKKPNKEGFLNVIHQVSPPVVDEDNWLRFSVDFGSITVRPVVELIHILCSIPFVKTVVLGSPEITGIS